MKRFGTFTFLLLILNTLLLGAATDPKPLLESMIGASGGEKNLSQFRSYEQVWNVESKTSETNGTDRRTVVLPGYLHTELVYPDKTEIRTLENGVGTKQFGNQTIPAQGPMLDAMRAQLLRLYHPLILKERLPDLSMAETGEYYLLTLREGSLECDYYVSKRTYRIDKTIGRLRMGTGSMEFVTLYDEYRSVGGVMFPHRETKFAGPVNTAVMHLRSTSPKP